MDIKLKIQPDLARLSRSLAGNVAGARRAGLIHIVADVEARGAKHAPVKKGNLANTHTSDVNADGTIGTVSFTALYAAYVHGGTGLYGPRRQMIRPKNTKALYWPGAAHPVRAVRGMPAQPFLFHAAEEADMEALYVEGAERYLERALGSAVRLEE